MSGSSPHNLGGGGGRKLKSPWTWAVWEGGIHRGGVGVTPFMMECLESQEERCGKANSKPLRSLVHPLLMLGLGRAQWGCNSWQDVAQASTS